MRGQDYAPIPNNRHKIEPAALLFPTKTPIIVDGSTSLDFVIEQGGDPETFIFMFGVSRAASKRISGEVIEGVFLNAGGPGFHATWTLEQLCGEIDKGGWRVIPCAEVLSSWSARVERRMNM
jgi:hypothetical protein